MKNKVALICSIFLMLSASILITSLLSYPDEARAYMGGIQNYQFQDIRHLPNGYRVGILGLGQVQYNMTAIYSSVNAGVQVVKLKDSKSVLKSVKLTYMTNGYTINNLAITNLIKTFNDEQSVSCGDLGYSICNLARGKTITGFVMYPSVQLRADLIFNDATYTIYSAKK